MRIKSNLKSKSFCEAQDSCETTEKKEIFVCEEYYMEDSLEEQDIFVDQEYFWKSFFSSRLFCLRIKLLKRRGEVKGP